MRDPILLGPYEPAPCNYPQLGLKCHQEKTTRFPFEVVGGQGPFQWEYLGTMYGSFQKVGAPVFGVHILRVIIC